MSLLSSQTALLAPTISKLTTCKHPPSPLLTFRSDFSSARLYLQEETKSSILILSLAVKGEPPHRCCRRDKSFSPGSVCGQASLKIDAGQRDRVTLLPCQTPNKPRGEARAGCSCLTKPLNSDSGARGVSRGPENGALSVGFVFALQELTRAAVGCDLCNRHKKEEKENKTERS